VNDELYIVQFLQMILKATGIQYIDSAFNGYEGLQMVIKK
jgi:YesN/AraC family two-component response regulator